MKEKVKKKSSKSSKEKKTIKSRSYTCRSKSKSPNIRIDKLKLISPKSIRNGKTPKKVKRSFVSPKKRRKRYVIKNKL